LPEEHLQNENLAASKPSSGVQACQNSSGVYPYIEKWKYFQLLSTKKPKLLNLKEEVYG
jgi:hypothetical protein